MQNLSLYSKFSLEIDWETSRSHKNLPVVKSSLFMRKASGIYKRYHTFSNDSQLLLHCNTHIRPRENKNVLILNKMVNVVNFLLCV